MNAIENAASGRQITICGREYRAEVWKRDEEGRPVYLIHGVRGARYATVRNRRTPTLLFLVNAGPKGFGMVRLGGRDTVWLTDGENGMLAAEFTLNALREVR